MKSKSQVPNLLGKAAAITRLLEELRLSEPSNKKLLQVCEMQQEFNETLQLCQVPQIERLLTIWQAMDSRDNKLAAKERELKELKHE